MATNRYIVEVEKGKKGVDGGSLSVGPVYRSIYAKDGFPEPADDLVSCWDIFRLDLSLNLSSLKVHLLASLVYLCFRIYWFVTPLNNVFM